MDIPDLCSVCKILNVLCMSTAISFLGTVLVSTKRYIKLNAVT